MATSSIREASRVVAEAKHPGLRDLGLKTLQTMLQEAKDTRESTAANIEALGKQFSEARESGQWGLMQDLRERILALQEDLQEAEVNVGRLEDAYQQRHLDEGALERLGSERKARFLEYTILGLILAVLAMLWVESAFSLTETEKNTLAIVDTAICAVFLTEFFWRMRFAASKVWYFKRYWVDFLASLPLAGMLRIGRIARLARGVRALRIARGARAARVVRALRGMAFLFRGFDKIVAIFRLQVFSRPLVLTVIVLIIGGFAISHMEGAASDDVKGFRQGTWWSFTTVITRGFAAIHNPQSTGGRGLTVLLVILGMILTGALTAGLASILLGDDTQRIERAQAFMQAQLDEMSAQMGRVEELLERNEK